MGISSCSNNKLLNVRNDIYDIGLESLAIVDDYLDMKIEVEEVNDKFKDLYDRFEEVTSDRISGAESFIRVDIISIIRRFNPDYMSQRITVNKDREEIDDEDILERTRGLNK